MVAAPATQDSKRNLILDSAGAAFARHGYEGASMSAITRGAGVSKATVYAYFGSKAELFGAYVQRECEQTILHVFEAIPTQHGVEDTLREIGLRMVGMMLSPTGLAIDRVVVSEAEAFPGLAHAFFEAGPERGIATMAAWIRTQVKAGFLVVEDPDFAAEQFFTLCQTRVVMRRRLRLPDPVPPGAVERVVDAAVHMFLATYAAPERAHNGRRRAEP